MKKFFALAAVAALFAGCDFAGSDVEAASIAGVTVSGVTAPEGQTAFVDVQDVAGRSFYRAELQPGQSIGSFELGRPDLPVFVAVYGQSASSSDLTFIASTPSFRVAELTGDTTFDMQSRDGATVGSAAIDLP